MSRKPKAPVQPVPPIADLMEPPGGRIVSARLPEFIYQQVIALAGQEHRTLANMIRVLLDRGLQSTAAVGALRPKLDAFLRRSVTGDGDDIQTTPLTFPPEDARIRKLAMASLYGAKAQAKPKRAYRSEMTMAEAIAADNAMDKRKAPKRRTPRKAAILAALLLPAVAQAQPLTYAVRPPEDDLHAYQCILNGQVACPVPIIPYCEKHKAEFAYAFPMVQMCLRAEDAELQRREAAKLAEHRRYLERTAP